MSRDAKRGASAWLQCRIRVLRRLLGGRLRLEGRSLDLRIVLDPAAPAPAVAAPPSTSGEAGPSSLPAMHPGRLVDARSDLTTILDQHPAARRLWPALALIERRLSKDGATGVARLSVPVLRDAARVLDRLVDDWCGPGLIALHEHVGLVLRMVHGEDPPYAAARAAPCFEMQVQDGSMTDFMAMDRLWDERLAHAA